jgi:hypothetical protein
MKKDNNVKVRRTWKMDPVERVHSRRKRPSKDAIPADQDIMQQLEEWREDELEGWTRDWMPDIFNLQIKK